MGFTLDFIYTLFILLFHLTPILTVLSLFIILLGQIVAKKENWNRFDGFYWSFITATTVGYGDIRPLKRSSKLISILIAFIGFMLTGIFVAVTISAATVAVKDNKNTERLQMIQQQIEQ